MNFWKWILFYVYSGVALNGLASTFSRVSDFEGDEGEPAKNRAMLIETAMQLGEGLADATSNAITVGHNNQVTSFAVEQYKQYLAREQQALADLKQQGS